MKTISVLLLFLFLAPLGHTQGYSQVAVTGYQLEGFQRIDRTHTAFTYGVFLSNSGPDIDRQIGAVVHSLDPNIVVQFPGAAVWYPIAANSTELSHGTIVLTIDHTKRVNFNALVWSFGR